MALTAVAGYTVPRLYEPLAVLRLSFLLLGGLLGVWGVAVGFTALLFDLCAGTAFGVPLLSPVSPFGRRPVLRDVAARESWKKLSRRRARVQDLPGAAPQTQERK